MIPGSIDLLQLIPTEYVIKQSLRFRGHNNASLSRTFGTPTNNKRWTWSGWVKLGDLTTSDENLFGSSSTASTLVLSFNTADRTFVARIAGTLVFQTTALFRDAGAWSHFVVVFDSDNATAADRFILYHNGVRQSTTTNSVTLGATTSFNAASQLGYIGRNYGWNATNADYFDGYMADIYFIDGQALTPSSFGFTNAFNQWAPKRYQGTYGTNGFYLPFNDATSTTTISQDRSGNGNNWTSSGISVTSGSTFDQMLDTPSSNYCVANQVWMPSTDSVMNVRAAGLEWGQNATNINSSMVGSFYMTTGKWYWEITQGGSWNTRRVGIQNRSATARAGTGTVLWRNFDGQKLIDGVNSAYGATFTTGDVLGFAYDADAGSLTCYKNNVSQGVMFSGGAGESWAPCIHDDNAGAGVVAWHVVNFGQRAFTYTPPTGFVALSSANLATPTIIRPDNFMNAVAYTGGTSLSWIAVSATASVVHAIRSDGTLWAWGSNAAGQLGDGTGTTRSSPIQIGTSSWIAVSSNGSTTAAIRVDGMLFAWGDNVFGELGDNTVVGKLSPVQIGTSSWSIISVGGGWSMSAITIDGRLFTWGYNAAAGRLGDGTTVNRSSPVQIGTSSWIAVSTGRDHTAAIRLDGALFTWGFGNNGRLGDNTTISKSSPVQIGSSSWTAASAGFAHTVAIRLSGALFTWGNNLEGQLGDVSTPIGSNRSSPVQVGSSSWVAISTILSDTTSAIRFSDRYLFTWGKNNLGQLGQNDIINRSSPTQVGSSSWSLINSSQNVGGAVDIAGRLFVWGENIVGQLGQNDIISRSSPVAVNTATQLVLTTRFQPDLLWFKSRNAATDHAIYDQVRGSQSRLESNNTDTQVTGDNGWLSATTQSFTIGNLAQINTINDTYVSWIWDETSTAGFDIVNYTGDNTSNRNISHSLNASPHFAIVKSQSTGNWWVWHRNLTGNTYFILLNSTAGQSLTNTPWGTGNWSSTQFMVTNNATENANANSTNYIAYLWSEVAGFSRFGSYVGNGSTDGPFVWCGFRPRFIMIKRSDSTDSGWMLRDAVRDTHNNLSKTLSGSAASAESAYAANEIDFLSNGFKLRHGTATGYSNNSGGTFIFAAFAEIPFKYATAR